MARSKSSDFYDREIYRKHPRRKRVDPRQQSLPGFAAYAEPTADNRLSKRYRNHIFKTSSEDMQRLPDRSIHLAVTSPPYNVGKDYDEDLSLEQYLEFLEKVFKEVLRVLTIGGRLAVNIANIGRKPYIPLHAYITKSLVDIGFLMRGEIIWDKGSSAGTSTAWGSWQSPSNPVLRDTHEYILIFSKENFSRSIEPGKATISKEDFLSLTKSVWGFQSESAKRVKHPAPFPEELPRRLIELYTQTGDVVLDPFMGVGTTAVAAKRLGRDYVGYEIDSTYHKLAKERLEQI